MMAAPFFLHEPSLTTLQLRQTHVAELKKNDEYWEERLKQLEDKHKKMNEIMEQETKKAIEELAGKRTPVAKKIEPPCLDSKKAVMECYACYPNEPMRCAKVVQAFQQCVDHKRSQIIAGRC
nr:unnamed protein product [Callosobruchus chinensis]